MIKIKRTMKITINKLNLGLNQGFTVISSLLGSNS
jgi:hypothetical protein